MINIVGDINFTDGFFDMGFGVGSFIKEGNDPFASIERTPEDFWIGNFECVCSSESNKRGSHANQFRIAPNALSLIKHMDLYGVANNHVMQHGTVAYNNFIAYLENNGIEYAGTRNKKTAVFYHKNKKIAITAFSQRPDNFCDSPLYWSLPDYADISSEIGKYSDCDFRIVYIHWGNEFMNYPYIDQKQFAHYLIDCGADLIVGMHPHVLQGFELYKGKHIFYSIGNFVFNMPWEPTKYAVIVHINPDNWQIRISYIKIINYCPHIIDDVPAMYKMEYLNKLLSINKENENYYNVLRGQLSNYRKENRKDIVRNIFRMNISDAKGMIIDFIKRH